MESNIRKLRKEKDISQMELADAIGVSQQVISRMENDRDKIRVKYLVALADYFHVTTDQILGYETEEEANRKKLRDNTGRWTGEAASAGKSDKIPENRESAFYELFVSMKRCLEECGI